ncbi:hypothetical protein GDO78_011712 [Eleutherodactylus coqui]|uniref:Myotubularin phosphatase domain-containing protein n=1 Tax=Eleutherodactylus coqui TaxID=57060 RepID=A0A8J6F2Z0_ELECQ|nr:hypothetical protein GDO78_011712 [Eleutherodactylus coqui]
MGVPKSLWQISDVNRDYRVCDTYPTELYVPKPASVPIIVGSSKFRSRGRFPSLSYYCQDNNASICRSSQPLSGFSARCLEDEQMLQAIKKANPGSDFLYVVDTRPKLNAMANRAAGKGYENEDNYSDIKFQFIGIENIHVMRNSLQKMIEEYGNLEGDPKEVSPVIDQFLECVWQLMEQFPCAFEFNERFLIHIQHHVYSCQYGNFLCNCEKERRELRIQERTYSLWSYLWKQRLDYMNPLYRPDHSQTQGTLRPNTTPCHFRFWRGLYNRFEKGMHPRQSVSDFLQAVKEETQQLEEEMEFMEKRLAKLETREANETNKILNDQPKIHNFQMCITKHSPVNTPQDYSTNLKLFPSRSPSQGEEDSALILTQDHLKSSDPDLSANSDQESGVEDLSCRSPSGGDSLPSEDSGKDPDSDEAVFLTA